MRTGSIHAFALAMALAGVYGGCSGESSPAATRGGAGGGGGGGGGRGGQGTAFPVEVAPVEAREVEYTIAAVGSVEAYELVQVTARVPGVVERVRFTEGDRVSRGRVLAEIEPDRYRLALESADAALEKAAAEKAEAEAGLARREGVATASPGLIPGEEIETWRTRVRTAAAEWAALRASGEQAKKNLHDSYARAPVAGVIQTRTVQTGQYVQPGVTLATLVRRDPLLLRFKVPESDAPRLTPGLAARFRVRNEEHDYRARIVHVGESAEEASRMVSVTAEVDDPEKERLRPGTFAEVTVPVGAAPNTPVIPQTAVRPSERGFLAFVVRTGSAEERVLQLGMRTADGLVEVREGLAPGDSLVVRGSEALRDGAKVRVMSESERAPTSDTTNAAQAPAGAQEKEAKETKGR